MALVLGFSDQAHFTRAFSQTVEISPAKWRRMRCH
ncbi:AraC family transcriptional regulator [Sinorhizobium sp. Sb3]